MRYVQTREPAVFTRNSLTSMLIEAATDSIISSVLARMPEVMPCVSTPCYRGSGTSHPRVPISLGSLRPLHSWSPHLGEFVARPLQLGFKSIRGFTLGARMLTSLLGANATHEPPRLLSPKHGPGSPLTTTSTTARRELLAANTMRTKRHNMMGSRGALPRTSPASYRTPVLKRDSFGQRASGMQAPTSIRPGPSSTKTRTKSPKARTAVELQPRMRQPGATPPLATCQRGQSSHR